MVLSLAFLCTFSINAQDQQLTAPGIDVDTEMTGPTMTFESLIVDFGEIEQHSDPWRVAKFTNTGSEPLVIKSARGSCGCTVPDWTKEPIMPGESSEMKIRYDTKRLGKINKTVTINTNAGDESIVLKVQGNISKGKDSVPAAPVDIFKPAGKSNN